VHELTHAAADRLTVWRVAGRGSRLSKLQPAR